MKRKTRRGDRRTINSSALKIDLASLPERRYPERHTLLFGVRAWSMAEFFEAKRLGLPCPVCRGRFLKAAEYCLGCDRAGMDRFVERGENSYPGLPEDYAPDPDYKTSGTSYKPGLLPGGKGSKARPGRLKEAPKRKTARRRKTG